MKPNFQQIRQRKIFLASPLYGGNMHFNCHQAICNLMMLCHREYVFLGQKHILNDSLVPRARNRLAAYFLETDCTDMLMVDSDIGFRAEDALSLMQFEEPIIGGIYSLKQIDWLRIRRAVDAGVPTEELQNFTTMPVLNWSRPVDGIELNRLYDGVKHMGTGFLRIRREVFERFIERYGDDIAFDYAGTEDHFKGKTGYDFFPVGIDKRFPLGSGKRQYLSEDWFCCERARECGFEIYAAPWVRLVHNGSYDFINDIEALSRFVPRVVPQQAEDLIEVVT